MISALIINLDQSVDRLKFQQLQLARLGIAMERVPAIQTAHIGESDYEKWANGWQRKMRPAEVACFLSHKMVWQHIVRINKPMLVLEDDALLSHQLPGILNAIENYDQLDYVNLETRSRRKLLGKKIINLVDNYNLRPLYQDRNGSAAYVLFPSGAQKLLARLTHTMPALADAFLSSAYELNAWQVFPAAAIQTDQCMNYDLMQIDPFTSTITSINQPRPVANNDKDYWCFKYRRIMAQLRMGIRQLSVFSRAEKLEVPICKNDFLDQKIIIQSDVEKISCG